MLISAGISTSGTVVDIVVWDVFNNNNHNKHFRLLLV